MNAPRSGFTRPASNRNDGRHQIGIGDRDRRNQHEGAHFTTRVYRFALYTGALNKLRGEPHGLANHPTIEKWIDGIAQAIKSGGVKSPEDIALSEAQKTEIETFAHLVHPFNFLKHADRDPDGTLDEGSINPIEATCFAVCAYTLLFPDDDLVAEVRDFLLKHGVI